jgi:hypothetical protein
MYAAYLLKWVGFWDVVSNKTWLRLMPGREENLANRISKAG